MSNRGDDGIRELAEQLLAVHYPGPGGRPQAVQFLVGQLPSGLPFELPVPPYARVVGSAVRRAGERSTRR